MRVTQHSGRTRRNGTVLGTLHNDRNFDTTKADNLREADRPNIYMALVEGKLIRTEGTDITFDQAERDFYERYFSEDLDQQNERAIRARHPERVQTIDQYRTSRKHAPEEVIIQIGKSESTVDRETFVRCVKDYLREMAAATRGNMSILNISIHFDEAVPHAHIRRVWYYQDETREGVWRIGQEKALENLGYDKACKREGREEDPRYNNRKVAFDGMMRERWLDICERHGIEVEREPVPDGKHNRSKEEMIFDKLGEAARVLQLAEEARKALEKTRRMLARLPGTLTQDIAEVIQELNRIGDQKDRLHDIDLRDWSDWEH